MSKVWKFLAKAGVVEIDDQDPSETPTAEPEAAAVAAVPAGPPPTASSSPVDASKYVEVDKACRDKLIYAMENDGAPLPEAFMETLSALEAIPVEESRFKTALTLMGKQGHTAGSILSDYDKTLGVLDETSRSFEESLKSQIDAKVGAKQQAVEQLTTAIGEKEAQIQALRVEIEQLKVQRDTEQSGIADEQIRISTVQHRFKVIYQAVLAEIQTQRAKIAQYGGV